MARHNVTIDIDGNARKTWFTWRCTCGKRGGRFGYPRTANQDAKNRGHR